MRALVTALLLTLAGCGLLVDDGTFQVGDVTVIDETGLVTAAAGIDPPSPADRSPSARRGDSLTELDLTWVAHSCIDGWTVRLAGNALQVTIEAGSPPADCHGTQAMRALRLTLNRAVDAEAVDVEVVGGS